MLGKLQRWNMNGRQINARLLSHTESALRHVGTFEETWEGVVDFRRRGSRCALAPKPRANCHLPQTADQPGAAGEIVYKYK